MVSRTLGLLVLAFAPLAVLAADPPPPWSGEVSAGMVLTSGNTDSTTINAKAQAVHNSVLWRNTTDAALSKASQTDPVTGADVRTAERYALGNKTDFNFTEHDYAFLALEFEKDLVGPVRERESETVGYGRKILTGPVHLLEAELGAGARQTTAQVTEDKASDFIGRARVAYKWNLSETSYLGETVKVESGKSNTYAESATELKMSLVGKLFAVASYIVRNNSDVPAGVKNTDTITALNLGWSFGK